MKAIITHATQPRLSRVQPWILAVVMAAGLLLFSHHAARAADPVVTLSNGVDQVTPGQVVTYTITVANPLPPTTPITDGVLITTSEIITNPVVQFDEDGAPITSTVPITTGASITPTATVTGSTSITQMLGASLTNMVLTDLLPPGTRLLAVSHAGAESSPGSGLVEWQPIDLAPGAVVTRTLSLQVLAPLTPTTTAITNTVTVSGVVAVDVDAVIGGVLQGVFWQDFDRNGLADTGEPRLAGVALTVTQPGADGSLGTADDLPLPLTSAVDGSYSAALLQPGLVQLEIARSSVPAFVYPVVEPDAVLDQQSVISITAGSALSNVNFGYAPVDLSLVISDGGVAVSPGATVVYAITLSNTSAITATNVVVTKRVPLQSFFTAGASATGWSCADGAPAGSECQFVLGSVAANSVWLITFAVTLNPTMPVATNLITDSVAIGLADPLWNDPTPANNVSQIETQVVAQPVLSLVQTDGSTRTAPGATLVYTITYENRGNQDTSGVKLTQAVPAHTRFVAGASTPGWDCPDGSSAGVVCTLVIGDLAVGVQGVALYVLQVEETLPVGVASLEGQVSITDWRGVSATDNELTPVDSFADLIVTLRSIPASVRPGETISHSVTFSNTGNQDAIGVVLVTQVPNLTTFVPSLSDARWLCSSGSGGGASCTLVIGRVRAGEAHTVTYVVRLQENLPAATANIDSKVVIAGSGIERDIVNNQANARTNVDLPTAVVLNELSATPTATSIVIRWVTAAEINTKQFHIARSVTGRWQDRQVITPAIAALGSTNSGAEYEFEDFSVIPEVPYTYWLLETETTGIELSYGPVTARVRVDVAVEPEPEPEVGGTSVFLPFVIK